MFRLALPCRLAPAVCITVLVGCGGGDGSSSPAEPARCPDDALRLTGGSCQPVGISADGCGEGFSYGGLRAGCLPVLPADDCPEGQMAVPGDLACRLVAPCPEGRFPEIPPEDAASAQYVDASFVGTSDGTAAAPWTSLQQGIDAAPSGAIVAVAPGSYAEAIRIDARPVRVWGRCPSEVEVVATGPANQAFNLFTSAPSGTELRGLAIRSQGIGIAATGLDPLVLRNLWIHDVGHYGMYFADDLGRPRVTADNLLVEGALGHGIGAVNADLTLERSVVRRGRAGGIPGDGTGVGVYAEADQELATLTVRQSVFARNSYMGIFASRAAVVVESTVVRDTMPDDATRMFGRGINVENDGSLAVVGCVLERNHEVGIYAAGVSLSVADTRIADVLLGGLGAASGIAIQEDELTRQPASATIRSSIVDAPASHGIHLVGSDGSVEATAVLDVPDAALGDSRGMNVQYDGETLARGSLSVWASRVRGVGTFGIAAIGSDLTVVDSEIADVLTGAGGLYGDGLVVASGADERVAAATADVSGTTILRASRAGLGVFGANAVLSGNALRCSAIDLAAELLYERPFGLEDLGGNVCGCETEAPCQAVSSQLQPPEPVR